MMTTILFILTIIFFFVSIVFFVISIKFTKKLFLFDELFEMIVDDIDLNVKYFENLLSRELFSASDEIRTANKNMKIIKMRLEEFSLRMNEARNKNDQK